MVSRRFRVQASVALSRVPGSYLYHIVPSHDSLAILTSSDEVAIVDQNTLQASSTLSGVPQGSTCLAGGPILACSGRDGSIALFDSRSQESFLRLKSDGSRAITSLALDATRIVCGTELAQSQAIIHVWDYRQNQLLWQSRESHNDDITQVKFHPTRKSCLLSGSTDGLVSLSDVNVHDENDALTQVINHGSTHKAGFLTETAIFALSHDEQFSVHSVNTPDEEVDEPSPIRFGDIRSTLSCDYAIDVLTLGENTLATGSRVSRQQVDLIPIASSPTWRLDISNTWSLEGAHEDETVRSVYVNELSDTVFTAGEDGKLKAFKDAVERSKHAMKDPRGSQRAKDQRYRPY